MEQYNPQNNPKLEELKTRGQAGYPDELEAVVRGKKIGAVSFGPRGFSVTEIVEEGGEKIPLYDEDGVGTQDIVRRKEELHQKRWGTPLSVKEARIKRNDNAKNAKRTERPKGSADLPSEVN